MSNGNVALILDVAGIVRVAHDTSTAVPPARPSATVNVLVDQGVVEAQVELVDTETPAEQTKSEIRDPVPTGAGA